MWWRYVLFRPFFALAARSSKYRLSVQGAENVPRYGPLIVVANHQSSIDVVAIALALKPALTRTHLWPWAKKGIEKGQEGLLGVLLWKVFGVIPVDREEGNAEEVIRLSLDRLRRGEAVLVFPEGTRSRRRELGWFQYGVANLARAAPAPILPVAVYRREEDGGVQVNIGKPFFMPPRRALLETLETAESRAEEMVSQQVEALRQWSEHVDRDRRGMRMIARIIDLIVDYVDRQGVSFDRFCRMAESEDNEFIRDRVFELLPHGWVKVEAPLGGPSRPRRPEEAEAGDR